MALLQDVIVADEKVRDARAELEVLEERFRHECLHYIVASYTGAGNKPERRCLICATPGLTKLSEEEAAQKSGELNQIVFEARLWLLWDAEFEIGVEKRKRLVIPIKNEVRQFEWWKRNSLILSALHQIEAGIPTTDLELCLEAAGHLA